MSSDSGSISSMSKLSISCSFINYDGVTIVLEMSNKSTIRQVKQELLKELLMLTIDNSHSSQTVEQPEDIITVTNKGCSQSEVITPSIIIHGILLE